MTGINQMSVRNWLHTWCQHMQMFSSHTARQMGTGPRHWPLDCDTVVVTTGCSPTMLLHKARSIILCCGVVGITSGRWKGSPVHIVAVFIIPVVPTADLSGALWQVHSTDEAPGVARWVDSTAHISGVSQSVLSTANVFRVNWCVIATANTPGACWSVFSTANTPGACWSVFSTANTPGAWWGVFSTANTPGAWWGVFSTANTPGACWSVFSTANTPGAWWGVFSTGACPWMHSTHEAHGSTWWVDSTSVGLGGGGLGAPHRVHSTCHMSGACRQVIIVVVWLVIVNGGCSCRRQHVETLILTQVVTTGTSPNSIHCKHQTGKDMCMHTLTHIHTLVMMIQQIMVCVSLSKLYV